jgi:hypothetical protein
LARDYEGTPSGCSKKLIGKAAVSEEPKEYPLDYLEGLNDARKALADFFSILLRDLVKNSGLDRWQRRGLARRTGKDER